MSNAAPISRAETIRRALRVNISAAEHEEVLAALDSLLAEREQFRAAAEGLLDVCQRSRSGDPSLDPEEWFAISDYARVVLADAK